MVKPDDSTLSTSDLKIIEDRAKHLLDRADAWEAYPVPVEDLLEAANVKVASYGAFKPQQIMSYLKGKASSAEKAVKSAISKILGIYDAADALIHIDETVVETKQTFLKLHETGHHDIPTHRKMFRFFQDSEETLAPDIADQFEREANNFARYVLFKGDAFQSHAADLDFGIKVPMSLAKTFGASIYASMRECARTNHRACVVYALEPTELMEGVGAKADVRRIECSPTFKERFGHPGCTVVSLDHVLGSLLPLGNRRMIKPTAIQLEDRNGVLHDCLAESFRTKYNTFILVYPVKELSSSIIQIPKAANF